MKMHLSHQTYGQLDAESRAALTPIACSCVKDGRADPDCDACDGTGTIYEHELSADDSAAILENLRSQGVPLGKIGTQ